MHILTIPTWYVTEQRPDVGIYFREMARFFKDAGHESGVVYADTNWADFAAKVRSGRFLAPRMYDDMGVHTVRYDGFGWPRRSAWAQDAYAARVYRLYKTYVQQFGKPDVVLAHSYPAAFAAAYIREREGIPFAYAEVMTALKDGKYPAAHLRMLRIAMDAASVVSAVSTQTRYWMQQVKQMPIEVIPLTVDTERFALSDRPTPTKTFTWVNVGDLIERRAPEVSLEAFALAKKRLYHWQLKLEMIGSGDMLGQLKAKAEYLGISKDVTFHGLMDNAEVGRFLSTRADALLLTSRLETFGVVLVEAMACGLPVVSTRSGGPGDIVNGVSGLLAPVDQPEMISEAMCRIVIHFKDYPKQAIRDYAVQTFGHQSVTQRWLETFTKMQSMAKP